MTKITHVKITHYIDNTKNKRKQKQQCLPDHRLLTRYQLNTTDAPSTTVGGQGAVNQVFI